MNKLQLISIASIAAVAVILLQLGSCQAASVKQIDQLKNQFLPPEYRNKNFTMDEVKKVIQQKCKKAAGGIENATLYQEIEKSSSVLMACLSGLANFTAIQEEIETARPLGELDTVFHKYCTKAPEAQICIREFNAKIQPCLSVEEKVQNTVMMRVVSRLMDFVCAKGGDQIALFVAEEGPECLEANKEAITMCMNSSFAEYLPKDGSMPDLFNLPELILEPKHCVDLEHFESCTLHHLEQCREITPANVAHSIFKFVKNETSCRSWIEAKANERPILTAQLSRAGGAAGLQCSTAVLSLVFGSILMKAVGRFF